MHEHHMSGSQRSGLETPMRNHYFYGQLLSVYNFELETGYFIHHRHRLNRFISGFGVVCGLNVELTDNSQAVRIGPGMAIDRQGREIVVARRSDPIAIPTDMMRRAVERAGECREDACVQVLICYHECQGDLAPVLAGDCSSTDACAPSTIREQYRIEFRPECTRRPHLQCRVPDLLSGGRLDYEALVKWVTITRGCPELRGDPCIPLANIKIIEQNDDYRCDQDSVDIAVRPILPSNAVLLELILALLGREARQSQYEQ